MADSETAERRLEQRKNVMLTALAVLELKWQEEPPPAVADLRKVLGSWKGVGDLVAGLNAQGYEVEFRQYPLGWRTNVYFPGVTHSVLKGAGWAPTPWESLQHAAWDTLTRQDPQQPGT